MENGPEYHVRNISAYTIIPNSFVRHGTISRSDGGTMSVIMVVNDDTKVVFAYGLREVDKLVQQLLAQRAIAASMEKPVTPWDFRAILDESGENDLL